MHRRRSAQPRLASLAVVFALACSKSESASRPAPSAGSAGTGGSSGRAGGAAGLAGTATTGGAPSAGASANANAGGGTGGTPSAAGAGNGSAGAGLSSSAGGNGEAGDPSSSAGSAGKAGDDIENVCADYASAYCGHYLECDSVEFKGYYASLDTCRERTVPICIDELSASGSGATPTAMASCTAALDAADCKDGTRRPIPECAWVGNKTEGAACRYDSQCGSGFCERPTRTWCGSCAPRLGVGETCDPNLPNGCEPGLACSTSDGCVELLDEGALCTSSVECRGPLRCPADAPRACAEPGGEGDSCQTGSDCDPQAGLHCSYSSSTCVVAELVGTNEPCNLSDGTLCAASGSCRAEDGSSAAEGTCAAPSADGESCALSRACLAPALCVDEICVPPGPASACVE